MTLPFNNELSLTHTRTHTYTHTHIYRRTRTHRKRADKWRAIRSNSAIDSLS